MKSRKTENQYALFKIQTIFTLVLVFLFFSYNIAFASPITQENVINLINQERRLNGLSDLSIDPELNRASQMKSKDMLRRNYFEHYAFGLTPWGFIRNSGYDYIFAGENLAMNFSTSEGMVGAWMNSPAHKENILNPNYSDAGVGIIKGAYGESGTSHETIMVTTLFGKKKPLIVNIVEKIRNIFPLY
jgi:uncharacterized protein YkwD